MRWTHRTPGSKRDRFAGHREGCVPECGLRRWLGPVPDQVKVVSNLCLGPLEDGETDFRDLSDDQAICIGYH